ncbi:MAG: LysR family transcriptional regulator [Oscillospiraceae bacterium]|nr:LysR family transcriptional regulator [Oscillospiraceae bacterium]
MNILHLKYAVEVAKTKSISKAAENLYMGQPNLSRAIKELEESLGITIFKRTSKGITTTSDGDEFLRLARRIVAQVEEVEDIYRSKRSHKQTFSVCVPRASYISAAMAEFSKNISLSEPADIFYKETNSGEAIASVVRGDYGMGVVRYQTAFEKYFIDVFKEKKLIYETVAEFTYLMLIRKNDPLAKKKNIATEDLADYIEITHGDPYVPSIPLIEIKKAELCEHADKRIFVYERASQLEILASVPKTFMLVSPMPRRLLDKYGLITRDFPQDGRKYKDVLIYRKDYKLTDNDKRFITEMCDSKHGCFT